MKENTSNWESDTLNCNRLQKLGAKPQVQASALGGKKRNVKMEANCLTLGLTSQLDLLKAIFPLVQCMHFLKAKGTTQFKIEP